MEKNLKLYKKNTRLVTKYYVYLNEYIKYYCTNDDGNKEIYYQPNGCVITKKFRGIGEALKYAKIECLKLIDDNRVEPFLAYDIKIYVHNSKGRRRLFKKDYKKIKE